MKNLIHLALALMILVGNQCPVISAPTRKPISKADKAQRYTVGMSLTGCNPVNERVQLTLAGHTIMSDTLTRLEGPTIHADDLKPGVYTATVTLLGEFLGEDNHLDTKGTYYTNDFINVRLGPWNLVKIISIGNSSSPTVISEVGGQTTTLVWKMGSNQDTSLFWKNAVAHNTIYYIGETCKIVFYLGPDAATFHIKEVQLPGSRNPGSCPLKKYTSGTNFIGKPVWADVSFFPSLNAINKAAGDAGVKVLITNSFRMAGQKLSGTVVKPATMSNHLVGHAIDMNVQYTDAKGVTQLASGPIGNNVLSQTTLPLPVSSFIQRVKADNLRWGGDFKTRDVVHFDDYYNRQPTQWKLKYTQIQKCAKMSGFVP